MQSHIQVTYRSSNQVNEPEYVFPLTIYIYIYIYICVCVILFILVYYMYIYIYMYTQIFTLSVLIININLHIYIYICICVQCGIHSSMAPIWLPSNFPRLALGEIFTSFFWLVPETGPVSFWPRRSPKNRTSKTSRPTWTSPRWRTGIPRSGDGKTNTKKRANGEGFLKWGYLQ